MNDIGFGLYGTILNIYVEGLLTAAGRLSAAFHTDISCSSNGVFSEILRFDLVSPNMDGKSRNYCEKLSILPGRLEAVGVTKRREKTVLRYRENARPLEIL